MISNNPTLEEAIQHLIDRAIYDIPTCLPGIVETYDKAKNKATITPCIKELTLSGKQVQIKPLTNVPVQFYRTGNFIIKPPIEKGTAVMLHFAHRPIDIWLKKGGICDQGVQRSHDLSDAIAVVGGYPLGEPSPASTSNEDLEIWFKESYVKILKNGDIILQSGSSGSNLSIKGDEININDGDVVIKSDSVDIFSGALKVTK